MYRVSGFSPSSSAAAWSAVQNSQSMMPSSSAAGTTSSRPAEGAAAAAEGGATAAQEVLLVVLKGPTFFHAIFVIHIMTLVVDHQFKAMVHSTIPEILGLMRLSVRSSGIIFWGRVRLALATRTGSLTRKFRMQLSDSMEAQIFLCLCQTCMAEPLSSIPLVQELTTTKTKEGDRDRSELLQTKID